MSPRRGGGRGGRARGEWAADGGAPVAGTRTRPRGSPGQHARLWGNKSLLLHPASSTASGVLDFRCFSPPNGMARQIRTRGVRSHFISSFQSQRLRTSLGLNAQARKSQLPTLYSEFVVVGSALVCKALSTASSMARGARAAEGDARVAGTRTRPRGSPG